MFLKRVCIFLAAAFIVVDLFLLSIYLQARKDFRVLPDEMIENAIQYYENNGVKIKDNVIKAEIPENAIYTFDTVNADCAPEIAEKVAKKAFSENVTVGFVETPKGISYSMSDDGTVKGGFRVYNDSFGFEYSVGEFSKENVPFSLTVAFENGNFDVPAPIKKQVESFVSGISLRTESEYSVCGVSNTGSGILVCIKQLVDGAYPIKEMFVNMLYSDNKLVYAEGNWIFGNIKKSYKEELTDGINALNKIDVSTLSEVISQDIIYMYRNSGSGRYYLVPVWKIEYIDTNSNLKTQYIDAIKS